MAKMFQRNTNQEILIDNCLSLKIHFTQVSPSNRTIFIINFNCQEFTIGLFFADQNLIPENTVDNAYYLFFLWKKKKKIMTYTHLHSKSTFVILMTNCLKLCVFWRLLTKCRQEEKRRLLLMIMFCHWWKEEACKYSVVCTPVRDYEPITAPINNASFQHNREEMQGKPQQHNGSGTSG